MPVNPFPSGCDKFDTLNYFKFIGHTESINIVEKVFEWNNFVTHSHSEYDTKESFINYFKFIGHSESFKFSSSQWNEHCRINYEKWKHMQELYSHMKLWQMQHDI